MKNPLRHFDFHPYRGDIMDLRIQLFQRAVSQRDLSLVPTAATGDPQWTTDFLCWLRSEPEMRPTAISGALEAARAMLAAGIPGSRRVVASVLRRGDDPGAALSYWISRYGRSVPKPVKRAIADAVSRLYTERALLRHDAAQPLPGGFRFADVIDLVHPTPATPWQAALFQLALARRRGRETPAGAGDGRLPLLALNARLRAEAAVDPRVLLDPARLRTAGVTWRAALSLAGSRVDRAELWRALVPVMTYPAILKNLKSFDEAQVCDETVAAVSARIADQAEVVRSRVRPFGLLAAHAQAPTLHWLTALDRALRASLVTIPSLPGRTLILVDMAHDATARAGAVYGVSLAAKGEDVVLQGFGTRAFRHEVLPGASVLSEVNRFLARAGEAGRGSRADVALAVAHAAKGYDRVVVVSAKGSARGGEGIHWLGEVSDHSFHMVPLLEAGARERWPWIRRGNAGAAVLRRASGNSAPRRMA